MGRRRSDQGAVAIVLSLVVCVVMIPLGGLAVDIGVQRVARRDVQASADTVSLDMARVLGSGTTPTDAMAQARAQSVTTVAGGVPTVRVYTGYVAATPAFASDQTLGCDGTTRNGYFTDPPAGEGANAVLVTSTARVPFGFMGGSGGVCRSAIAGTRSTACFKLGSYAARISSGDSTLLAPLNSILGVSLGLADYKGLATEKVTLADLGATSQIGSVDQLLVGGVTYNQLALAALSVVNRTDPGNTVAIAALNKLVQASTAVAGTVKLGTSVVSASPSDAAALETGLNLLDLLTGTVLAADGSYGISASSLQAQVPGLGNVASSSLRITQAAQTACGYPGEATAHASQLSGSVVIPAFQSSSVNLPGPGPTMKTQTASASFAVTLGDATGVLADPVVCGDGTTANPHKIPVNVAADAGSVALNAVVPATLDTSLSVLLSLYSIHFDYQFNVYAGTAVGASTASPTLTIPPNDVTPVTTGSPLQLPTTYTVQADPTASIVTVKLLGGTVYSGPLSGVTGALGLSGVTGLVSSILNTTTTAATTLTSTIAATMSGMISNLNSLLAPWSSALGLAVGGADVFAVKSPVCNSPVLKG